MIVPLTSVTIIENLQFVLLGIQEAAQLEGFEAGVKVHFLGVGQVDGRLPSEPTVWVGGLPLRGAWGHRDNTVRIYSSYCQSQLAHQIRSLCQYIAENKEHGEYITEVLQ